MSNLSSTGPNLFSGLIKKKNGGGGKSKKVKSETAQNNSKKNNNKIKSESERDEEEIQEVDTHNIKKKETKKIKKESETNETKNIKENNLNDLKKSLFGDDSESKQMEDTENLDSDQNENTNDVYGKNSYLNSQWTVWVHRNDCDDWTVDSYKNIHLIDSIGTFWEFFNNFHKINKEENQYFIMRNKIKPIWEDNNNRSGGICSLKMDCYDRNNKKDIGSEFLLCLCVLMMNESFMQDNQEINGISYAVKNRSIYIKIWTKDYSNNIVDKLPKNLINKFNSVIRSIMFKKFENYISIRYKPIKPEYEDQEK
jgi:hypothetical protein